MQRNWLTNWRFVSGLFFAFSVLAAGHAQSQPPSVSVGTAGQPQKQEAKDRKEPAAILQRGTKELPLIVEFAVQKHLPDENTHQSEGTTADRRMVWLTAGLLVIAGCQLFYFRKQLRVMNVTLKDARDAADAATRAAKATEDSVDAMRLSAERQLRAYVAIVHGTEKGEDPPDDDTFRIKIKNCGQTPAYELECDFGWKSFPGKETEWPEGEPFTTVAVKAKSKGTVGAGFQIQIDTNLDGLSDYRTLLMEKSKAFGGRATVYFYGTVSYRDIFDKEVRITNFCFRFVPGRHPSNGTVYSCHNDST